MTAQPVQLRAAVHVLTTAVSVVGNTATAPAPSHSYTQGGDQADNRKVSIFALVREGGPMAQNGKTGELTASIAETAIYTMLLSQALFELLEEKGLVTRAELTERMKKLEGETAYRMWRSNDGKPNLSS
jgi:hypothetical protein